jgi:ABC-2 type transport system ATP-binding protein
MLKLIDVNKSYQKKPVLRNLSFEILPHEVYGLLGNNGAGKTTTINIICHLLNADSGIVEINDYPVSQKTKQWIGIVPQENLLYKSLTCQENLSFISKIYGLNKEKQKENIYHSLKAVNLLDKAHFPVEKLSGGMQRRLSIAAALVHHPKLLILDEPTTGLDIESRYEIWELIETLQRQGMTILLTTHLLDEAQHLCQRIGILQQGQIIAEGTLETLRKHIAAQEIVFIESSQMDQLLLRAKSLGLTHRRYGKRLGFWFKEMLELSEILEQFAGISIDSISRQSVQLEHIYLELTQFYKHGYSTKS